MKRNALFLLLFVCLVACKEKKSPEASIIAFLTDVKNPKLTFDDIYEKHIDFENRSSVNPLWQSMIENNLHEITQYLNKENVDPKDLTITRYDKADRALQHLIISKTPKERIYVVQGKNSFKRYILLDDDNDIKTWMTIKNDRVFLLF